MAGKETIEDEERIKKKKSSTMDGRTTLPRNERKEKYKNLSSYWLVE